MMSLSNRSQEGKADTQPHAASVTQPAHHIEENGSCPEWELPTEEVDLIDQIEQMPRLVNPVFGEFED